MFRKIIALSVSAALVGTTTTASAAGFALIEQNASGLGNAYAGQAASAQDASTIFFNPAGMTLLPGRQVVGAVNLILPSGKFNNTRSTAAGGGFTLAGGNGGDAGALAAVPNMYLSWQINPAWFVGVGVNAPFGLATEYDAGWLGRFHAIKSEIKTINVNPSVAFKVSDNFSIGAGVNWQRAEAEITKAVNYTAVAAASGSAALAAAVGASNEGSNKIDGNDSSWGFNLGILFKPQPNTTIGVSYRSAMNHTLSGSVVYNNRPAAITGALAIPALFNQVGDGPITAKLKLPASYSFAVKHQVNSKWDLLADATRTQWSSIQSLDIIRSTGTALENVPFQWKDTWRFGLGVNYRYDDAWTLRGGVAFDKSPVDDVYRIPRLPDEDRTWVSFGAQYRITKQGAIDFGYAHLFVKDPSVNLSGLPALPANLVAGRGALVGNYNSQVNIVSLQYRHSF